MASAGRRAGRANRKSTADVEGIDCANKLSILIALAFGKHVPPAEIPTKGITEIAMDDISKAAASGNKIKLISGAKIDDNGRIECEVKPTEIPLTHPLAGVNNSSTRYTLPVMLSTRLCSTEKARALFLPEAPSSEIL